MINNKKIRLCGLITSVLIGFTYGSVLTLLFHKSYLSYIGIVLTLISLFYLKHIEGLK